MSTDHIDDGGAAFPCFPECLPSGLQDERFFIPSQYGAISNGMTLRDYFAAVALAGECSRLATPDLGNHNDDRRAHMAQCCYKLADAMLRERQKGTP